MKTATQRVEQLARDAERLAVIEQATAARRTRLPAEPSRIAPRRIALQSVEPPNPQASPPDEFLAGFLRRYF